MKLEYKPLELKSEPRIYNYKHPVKIGDVFGNLVVIEIRSKRVENKDGTRAEWQHKCLCICGNYCYLPFSRLVNGNTRTCGCRIGTGYLGKGVGLINNLIGNYKYAAKTRNIEWKLTDDEARALFNCACYYCGVTASRTIKRVETQKNINKEEINFNGIDRLVNEQGYTPENSVPCCILCNRIKMDGTVEEFLDKVKQIYNHLNLSYPTLLEMCA